MTKSATSSRGKRQLLVRHQSGQTQPFLRGMVTHDLVQRGVPFDAAYAVARALRDELADRGEIRAAELGALIDQRVRESYPHAVAGRREGRPRLEITYDGQRQPFSRGILAQSLLASGLDHDRAYRLVLQVQQALLDEDKTRVDSKELARRVAEELERTEGKETAGRYRLMRRIHRLPHPLVIYLGGATGVGKSTLSLDLAPQLRIFRVNSTDTIREVLRLTLTTALLPSLHRSSFEIGAPVAPGEDEEAELERAFEEQAVRVCVGVRAMVERAIAENASILVEGVHLLPPHVPFHDLDAAAYQVMVMLMNADEETHRSHLLARSRRSQRAADRYLDHFDAIRHLQDLLLARAEEHEIPLLDTFDREQSAQAALRLITGVLQQRLPALASPEPEVSFSPSLLLIIDGLADRPIMSLGNRTPLAAAQTPTLDRLAREGRVGLADPIAPEVVPDTAAGTLALLGQPPRAMKRGPIEALGSGLDPAPDAIALRANFATTEESGLVVDRRAGRIREGADELAAAIDRLALPGREFADVEVRVRVGTEHRFAVVLSGPGLSPQIAGSDPGESAPPSPPLVPRPLTPDDEAAERTARALALFEQEARRVLAEHPLNRERARAGLPPANCILTRGAGRIHRLGPLEAHGLPLHLVTITGDRTVAGITKGLGGKVISTPSMTANLDTNLEKKFQRARRALEDNDLVVVHIKGADVAAHDRHPEQKVAFLELLDAALAELLEGRSRRPLRIAVSSDHATYSDTGQHGPDPVPVLIWGAGVEPDDVTTFDEVSAATGSLQRFPLQLLLEKLFGR